MGRFSKAFEKHDRAIDLNQEESSETPRVIIDHAPLPIVQSDPDPKIFTIHAPDSFDAELFKVLRTQILFPKDGNKRRSIIITSSFPSEGKSFVSANIAASIARGINDHVLLIDADLRRPKLHTMFGYSRVQGLNEYLTDQKNLDELIIRTQFDKLSLLPAGGESKNATELLSSNKMKEFLKEVKDRYKDRLIIIDSAPVQATSEASVLSNYVDGTILVVRNQKTPREGVLETVETLGRKNILGVVLNGCSKSMKKYGKYYGNYYK